MRNYGHTVRRFAEVYGTEKSTVSEQFVEASRQKPGGVDRAGSEEPGICVR